MRRYKYLLFSIISFMLFNINIVLADTMDACTNVGVLKVIYFIKLLLNIAFIAVPIGLIVFGLIDFSKSVASGDEKDGKKNLNLFIKRLIYGALVFFFIDSNLLSYYIKYIILAFLSQLFLVKKKNIPYSSCASIYSLLALLY